MPRTTRSPAEDANYNAFYEQVTRSRVGGEPPTRSSLGRRSPWAYDRAARPGSSPTARCRSPEDADVRFVQGTPADHVADMPRRPATEPVGPRRRRAREPVRRSGLDERSSPTSRVLGTGSLFARPIRGQLYARRSARCSTPRLRPERLPALSVPSRWPWTAKRSSASPNVTFEGSRIGFLKRTSTVNASGSRSAARQRAFVHMPCAIARGKPNAFAVQPVQVDRVVVAGDGGVAAAEVVGQAPLGGHRRDLERPGSRARLVAVAALEVRGDVLPDELVAHARSETKSNCAPAPVRAQLAHRHASDKRLAEQQRPVLDDPVGDVDDADGAERRLAPAAPCAARTRARAGTSAAARRAA